jgi:hypothetical protein
MTDDITCLCAAKENFSERPAEFWRKTSPLALAKLIEQVPSSIEFHPGEHHDFVAALAKVKRAVAPERWRRVLRRLVPVLWVSCEGGPGWDPRVLANGGVAVRNFHRILGLQLAAGVSVSGASLAMIRREVQTVLRRGVKAQNESVMLMHHASDGIIYTQEVPEDFQFLGQSILFCPASLTKGLSVLSLAARATSPEPQEMLAIRLFTDTVCAYTMYRHGDDADTVVESFAASRLDSDFRLSTAGLVEGPNAWPAFVGWAGEVLDQELPCCDVPRSLRSDIRALMTSDETHSWASQCFGLLGEFPALFGQDPLRLPNADTNVESVAGREPSCLYAFEKALSSARAARAIQVLAVQGAPLMARGGACEGLRVPYSNLETARRLASALRRRFGPLRLTIPHLGLDHREPFGAGKRGNSVWFGFGRRNGIHIVKNRTVAKRKQH